MKKFALIALGLTVGVSCAFAASIKVPWFIDNADVGAGLPPTGGGDGFPKTLTLISLSNTTPSLLKCEIAYYDANGNFLGPVNDGINNTFFIQPNATVQFRPVAKDLVNSTTNPQGQESEAGFVVPDRPNPETGKNGSITITYEGAPADMAGQVIFYTQGSTRATAFAAGHALVPKFGDI